MLQHDRPPAAAYRPPDRKILAWYHSRLTNRQMAKRYGIARGTLENIIRTHGTHYKQAPPERRNASLEAQRNRRARLMAQDLL